MTHLCEVQNEVNPYIVETGWSLFGEKPHPEATKALADATTRAKKSRDEKRKARKEKEKSVKTKQTLDKAKEKNAKAEKDEAKRDQYSAEKDEIDRDTIKSHPEAAKYVKNSKDGGPPERQAPTQPPHRRITWGDQIGRASCRERVSTSV